MATTQELEQALMAADAAGDVEAATLIAREIQIRRETGGERGVIPMMGDEPLPSEMAQASSVKPTPSAPLAPAPKILVTLPAGVNAAMPPTTLGKSPIEAPGGIA